MAKILLSNHPLLKEQNPIHESEVNIWLKENPQG